MKRTHRRRHCAVFAFLSALTSGSTRAFAAAAEEGHAAPAVEQRAHVGLDAAVTTSPKGASVSSLGAALRLGGDYQFASGVGVLLEGGFVSVSLDVEGQRTRRGTFPGNLLLGASFERAVHPELELGASVRVGAPLALYPGGIDANRLAELAYVMAASAHGFRDPFLWQTNVVPLVLGCGAALRASERVTLRARLAPAYLVSVNQRPSRLAFSGELDASAVMGWLVGHVGLSYFLSTLALENRHLDQLALRVGAGAVADRQRWTLELSAGLDAPYGAFQSAPRPWWGIGIAGDVEFGG